MVLQCRCTKEREESWRFNPHARRAFTSRKRWNPFASLARADLGLFMLVLMRRSASYRGVAMCKPRVTGAGLFCAAELMFVPFSLLGIFDARALAA